jgi:hypothetical protein
MEFGPVKFQQGAIGVAGADFARKSGDFSIVGGNVGGGWPLPYQIQEVQLFPRLIRQTKKIKQNTNYVQKGVQCSGSQLPKEKM